MTRSCRNNRANWKNFPIADPFAGTCNARKVRNVGKLARGNGAKGDAVVIRKFTCAAGLCALIAPIANAATVSVPDKSQPESITVAPNGDLILGSASSPKIYRVKKGSDKAEVFVDVSADGGGSFLGVLADASTTTLWACQIYTTPPGNPARSALRAFDLKTGAAKFRWELSGEKNLCNDFVVGPDKALYISDTVGAKIWRLKPGATCRRCSVMIVACTA
jgi:streptogramin lyase